MKIAGPTSQPALLATLAAAPISPSTIRALVKGEQRAARERELTDRTKAALEQLPTLGVFDVLLADPPLSFTAWNPQTGGDRLPPYPTMSAKEVAALPVDRISARNCILFLWGLSPQLPAALHILEGWGFAYKSSLVWVKPSLGMGYWFRSRHELLLVGTRGKPRAPARGAQPQSVLFARRRRHSEKPSEVHAMIETLYPTARKLELFARASREGWRTWGNEVDP